MGVQEAEVAWVTTRMSVVVSITPGQAGRRPLRGRREKDGLPSAAPDHAGGFAAGSCINATEPPS